MELISWEDGNNNHSLIILYIKLIESWSSIPRVSVEGVVVTMSHGVITMTTLIVAVIMIDVTTDVITIDAMIDVTMTDVTDTTVIVVDATREIIVVALDLHVNGTFTCYCSYIPLLITSRYERPRSTQYRLLIDNLPSGINWTDLKDYFRTAGNVTYANVDRDDYRKGYAIRYYVKLSCVL